MFRDGGITINSGTVKLRGSYPVGTRNTVLGTDAGNALVAAASNNVLIGYNTGPTVTSGKSNTLVGPGAGSALIAEQFNTIVGGFTGNEFALNITDTYRNIVLSDGSGIPIMHGKIFTDPNQVNTFNVFASLSINSTGAIARILDEDNMLSNRSDALATQASIKAYVDANAGGGGGGTLAQVLAAGNTSGINGIVMDTGQSIQVDRIDETSPGAGVIVEDVLFRDGGIAVDAGTVKLRGSYPVGTRNTVLGTDAGNALVAAASNNVLIGYSTGSRITSGRDNTLVGQEAGSTLVSEQYNTVVGGFIGHDENHLDIRGTDRNVVLSDGTGVPVVHFVASTNPALKLTTCNILGSLSVNGSPSVDEITDTLDYSSGDTELVTASAIRTFVLNEKKAFGSFMLLNNLAFTGTQDEFNTMKWKTAHVTNVNSLYDFELVNDGLQIKVTNSGFYRFHHKICVRKISSNSDNNLLLFKLLRGRGTTVPYVIDEYRSMSKTRFTSGALVPDSLPDEDGSVPPSFGIYVMEYTSPPKFLKEDWIVQPVLKIDPINDNYLEKNFTTFTIEQVD